LPVILPDRAPEPDPREARMRDPFEPIERQLQPEAEPPKTVGAAKMDQIKDLYLTAEAIGEDALDQHFEQVSDRQRQLIREYFDQMTADGGDTQPKS
jgi:hypothetical protein